MKQSAISPVSIGLSSGLTLTFLAIGLSYGTALSIASLSGKLLFPVLRLMGFIVLGLTIGQVIEATGWTRYLSVVARPVFRFSNIGERCSAAFTAAFFSGVAANAMLLDFYQENHISKTQLFLTNYVNQLPAFFLHLPTTFFIVVPLTGTAGILYFILTLIAALFRTALFLIFGRLFLEPARQVEAQAIDVSSSSRKSKKTWSEIFQSILKKLPTRAGRIAVYVLPIYTLVFVLNANGFFDYLNETATRFFTLTFIPIESLSVVILSFAAEFTSGFAAAGALLNAGLLTTKQTVVALLLGNVIAFPIRALRHQLPRYMGIYSPKMGLQLLLSGQLFRVASILFIGTIYYMVA